MAQYKFRNTGLSNVLIESELLYKSLWPGALPCPANYLTNSKTVCTVEFLTTRYSAKYFISRRQLMRKQKGVVVCLRHGNCRLVVRTWHHNATMVTETYVGSLGAFYNCGKNAKTWADALPCFCSLVAVSNMLT